MPIVCPIIRLHFHTIINLILLIGSRDIPVHTACYSVCPTETNMHRTRRNWQKCVKNLSPEKNCCLLIFQSFSISMCHTRESKVNDQKLIVMRATSMRISRISHINGIARILIHKDGRQNENGWGSIFSKNETDGETISVFCRIFSIVLQSFNLASFLMDFLS